MKNAILALGATSLLSVLSAGVAAADPMSMMNGFAACNTTYGQCIKDGTDMMMAATPQEGMSKIQMNMSHAHDCASQLQACYAAVK